MAYFTIMTGLRGCYMPDQAYIVRVATRRELKAIIASEADIQRGDGINGLSKVAIASHAAECWRRRNDKRWAMDLALPFGTGTDRSYAIFVSRSTRSDYLAQSEDF